MVDWLLRTSTHIHVVYNSTVFVVQFSFLEVFQSLSHWRKNKVAPLVIGGYIAHCVFIPIRKQYPSWSCCTWFCNHFIATASMAENFLATKRWYLNWLLDVMFNIEPFNMMTHQWLENMFQDAWHHQLDVFYLILFCWKEIKQFHRCLKIELLFHHINTLTQTVLHNSHPFLSIVFFCSMQGGFGSGGSASWLATWMIGYHCWT